MAGVPRARYEAQAIAIRRNFRIPRIQLAAIHGIFISWFILIRDEIHALIALLIGVGLPLKLERGPDRGILRGKRPAGQSSQRNRNQRRSPHLEQSATRVFRLIIHFDQPFD